MLSHLLHLLTAFGREYDRLTRRALHALGLELGPAPAGRKEDRP